MSISLSEANSKRLYRLRPYFFAVNFVQAAAAIVLGGFTVWEHSQKNLQGNIAERIFGIGLFFVAAFLVLEALNSSVILEQGTVSVRHFWGTTTQMKDEILGIRTEWRYGIAYTVLSPKRSTEEDLEIARSAYSFDEAWVSWISSLPDLDKAQRMEVARPE